MLTAVQVWNNEGGARPHYERFGVLDEPSPSAPPEPSQGAPPAMPAPPPPRPQARRRRVAVGNTAGENPLEKFAAPKVDAQALGAAGAAIGSSRTEQAPSSI